MWSAANNESMSTSDFGGSGGFYDTTNKFDSPGTGKKQGGTRKAQSVTPIVVCMLKNCETEEFTMWGSPTTILKLVCIVRKFEITSTTVTYELEDHTGTMKAVLWLEHDAGSEPNIPVDKENIYVRCYGTLRTKGDEKLLMILKIAPIDKLNEITSHLLETILVRVKAEKKHKGEEVSIKANNPGAQLSSSMMNYGGMEMEEEGMTPVQRNVFKYMKSINTEMGVSRASIQENFPPNQKKEIDAAINFLVSEGHIFSTIDHDHFQLTTA